QAACNRPCRHLFHEIGRRRVDLRQVAESPKKCPTDPSDENSPDRAPFRGASAAGLDPFDRRELKLHATILVHEHWAGVEAEATTYARGVHYHADRIQRVDTPDVALRAQRWREDANA